MNIVVLLGSPNRQGSSRMLAESFRQGAEEAGHKVELIDAAHSNIHPCTGCIHCGYEGPCSQKDDVDAIRTKILDADMMVFCRFADFPGQLHDLKGILFFAGPQEFLVDGVVQAHAHDAQNPQEDPGPRHQDAAPADHLHGQAHPQAQDQGCSDAETIGKNGGRALCFPVQLPQGNYLGGVLGGVFVGNGFRKNFIRVHSTISSNELFSFN